MTAAVAGAVRPFRNESPIPGVAESFRNRPLFRNGLSRSGTDLVCSVDTSSARPRTARSRTADLFRNLHYVLFRNRWSVPEQKCGGVVQVEMTKAPKTHRHVTRILFRNSRVVPEQNSVPEGTESVPVTDKVCSGRGCAFRNRGLFRNMPLTYGTLPQLEESRRDMEHPLNLGSRVETHPGLAWPGLASRVAWGDGDVDVPGRMTRRRDTHHACAGFVRIGMAMSRHFRTPVARTVETGSTRRGRGIAAIAPGTPRRQARPGQARPGQGESRLCSLD